MHEAQRWSFLMHWSAPFFWLRGGGEEKDCSESYLFGTRDADCILDGLHRKKKVREFPVPSRDVTTKLSLDKNNDVVTELFLPRGSLVSDIPAGDGKLVNIFFRCNL